MPAPVHPDWPDLFFGRLPRDHDRPRVELSASATLTPPKSVDRYKAVPADGWGMLANDRAGDCVDAGMMHTQQLWEKVARNIDTRFDDDQALDDYSAITGYRDGNEDSDTGMTLQQGASYWRKTGIGTHRYKISAFAGLDVSKTDLIKNCINLFGAVLIGLEVPASAMDQVKAGKPWTVTSARSRILGGHCIPLLGYDSRYVWTVSWDRLFPITWGFYRRYFDEALAPVSPDWMTAAGTTPSGLGTAEANADYQRLTGSHVNPFPVAA